MLEIGLRKVLCTCLCACVWRVVPTSLSVGRGGGGGGGELCHICVNHPQKSTLNEDSRVDQKTPLPGGMDQLSHPTWGWLSCLHDQLYPKPGLFSYFKPQTRIRFIKEAIVDNFMNSDILNLAFRADRNWMAHLQCFSVFKQLCVFNARFWGLLHLFWRWFQVNVNVLYLLPFPRIYNIDFRTLIIAI